ncbi:MAG: ribonuclease E/G, partial [Alphaproteobacteria bacterium]|nr:ribonuclease E/G [Alphaproteobacteria bacterium]
MIDTIVCDKQSGQIGIALLGDGEIKEIEFANEENATEGSIYLGKIIRKLELAHDKVGFMVDIDSGRDAFMMAEEFGLQESNFHEGQSLLVQVSQEARAEKGAKLVRSIQLVGDYIVYCPYRMDVSASSRIEDIEKLREYKKKVIENTTGQEGWILRTSSVEVDITEILAEMTKLRNEFEQIMKKARVVNAPALLYRRGNLLFDAIARHKQNLRLVITNSRNVEAEIKEKYGDNFDVEIKAEPLTEIGIDDVIFEATRKCVRLPSGGRICIEETRACVAIDVDSGEDRSNGSISHLNIEAAQEIVKQIRLRNLAGKIVIDFAGSSEYRFIKPVLEVLENELKKDSIKSSVLGLSRAGNVEIVRVRRRPSLREIFTTECECCEGTGR